MINNRVLIIEDDRMIAEYFQAVLTMAGMEVEVLLTAREGLIRLAGTAPGLILLDLHLGNEIGGEDILYQIRSNPRLDHTRVIVVTGYPNSVQTVSDLADLVLIKPVGIDQLTALAQRMISMDITPKAASFRDPVTSLFNLEFFYTRLELAFERGKRRPEFLYAVIMTQVEVCGTDGKPVRLNVDQSNAVLMEIAARLKQNLRPTDTIAHVTGWRFASLHEDLRCFDDTAVIIDRIRKILAAPPGSVEGDYTLNLVCTATARDAAYRAPADLFAAANRRLEQALAG